MTGASSSRCADDAAERHDEQAGTAAPARGWVLVEHPGPWPFAGFAELDLPAEVMRPVLDAAARAGMRVVLVRRHGRRPHSRSRSWAVLRYDARGEHRQEWGRWSEDTDLLQIVGALGRLGRTGLPSVHLVCTHGVHDTCCAVRGRPVARALSTSRPDSTWECSHIGGDRFAANLLVAPDGIYYGEVTPDDALAALDQLDDGLVCGTHLRGYTDLGPVAQVAVVTVLRRLGPAGRHDIQVVSVTRDGDGATITLTCRAPLPQRIEVRLRTYALPPARLTCRAPAPSRAVGYEVTGFEVRD